MLEQSVAGSILRGGTVNALIVWSLANCCRFHPWKAIIWQCPWREHFLLKSSPAKSATAIGKLCPVMHLINTIYAFCRWLNQHLFLFMRYRHIVYKINNSWNRFEIQLSQTILLYLFSWIAYLFFCPIMIWSLCNRYIHVWSYGHNK